MIESSSWTYKYSQCVPSSTRTSPRLIEILYTKYTSRLIWFTCFPFGIASASTIFQKMMDTILQGILETDWFVSTLKCCIKPAKNDGLTLAHWLENFLLFYHTTPCTTTCTPTCELLKGRFCILDDISRDQMWSDESVGGSPSKKIDKTN